MARSGSASYRKKVLVTGFEAFGNDAINPSALIIEQLSTYDLVTGNNAEHRKHQVDEKAGLADSIIVRTALLPVVQHESVEMAVSLIKEWQPDVVLMLGQAAGRADISFEKVAINLDDFRIPDNAGRQPVDEAIVQDGPAAIFTTLPIKAIAARVNDHDVPASISFSAGTFVCNHLFYGVLHALQNTSIKADFIHVPLLPEQAAGTGQPSMMLETMVTGIKQAIVGAVFDDQELNVTAGTIC